MVLVSVYRGKSVSAYRRTGVSAKQFFPRYSHTPILPYLPPIFAVRGIPDMAKIGIFGGTFDPVHVGHIRVAREFAAAYGIKKVLMMVAADPPHRDLPSASSADRLHMVRLAVAGDTVLQASDLELRREGPSYTIDTIQELEKSAEGNYIWMALGGDAYALIRSWHRPGDVLARIHLVVLTRPGYPVDLLVSLPEELRDCYTLERDIYIHKSGATLRTLQVSPVDVSSSMIRQAVMEGRSISDLVSPEVLAYIRQRKLYRS
jgi:nicotinate-nucleotide adenylyltransferase